MEKLKNFETVSESNKNNPNKLLNNLCTGLETFLGFNKDSKGYTGQGIVYSDLDRLCDGVMGFLSGVLEGVKNANEVTTYDKHLEKKLNEVLEEVNKKIGSGRAGLVASVEQVKRWLEKYNSTVTEKTEKVTKKLLELKNNMANKYTQNITNNASNDLTKQLSTWKETVADVFGDIVKIKSEHISKLDNALKTKINSEMKVLNESVKLLIDSAGQKAFGDQVSTVDDQLVRQRKNVENAINTESEKYTKIFNSEFSEVENKIKSLEKIREYNFAHLKRSVWTAKQEVQTLLRSYHDDYKSTITKLFDDLKDAMSKIDKSTFPSGNTGRSALREQFESVTTKLGHIGDGIDNKNEQLKEWRIAASKVVKAAEDRVRDILRKVDDTYITNRMTGTKTEIKKAAKKLKADAEKLWKEMTEAHQHINGRLSAALSAIQHVDKAVKTDLETLREGIKTKIMEYFAELGTANFGNHVNNWNVDGLDAISEKLDAWIKAFRGDGTSSGEYSELLRSFTYFQRKYHINGLSSSSDGDNKNAFAAMQADAEGKITETYGVQEDNKIENHMEQYNSDTGMKSVTTPLNDIDTEKGLKKLTNVKDSDEKLIENQNTFTSQLDIVTKQLKEITWLVDKNRGTKPQPLPEQPQLTQEGDDEGIRQKLDDMTTALGITEQWKNDTVIGNIIPGLQKIWSEFVTLRNSISECTTSEQVSPIIDKLEELPYILEDKRTEALNIMGNLEQDVQNIQKNIVIIEKNVSDADADLTEAIQSVQYAYNKSYHKSMDTFQNLKHTILANAARAFATVTTEIRSLFAKQHEADLLASQTLVIDQTRVIRKIISDDKRIGVKGLLAKLSNTFTTEDLKSLPKQDLEKSANDVKSFFTTFFDYLKFQQDFSDLSPDRLTPLSSALSALLSTMHQHNHFDHTVSSRLSDLQAALDRLTPAKFAEASPLLNVLKAGVQAFHGELTKQYVSRYSGKEITWVKPNTPKTTKDELTTDATKCAKVFMTILGLMFNDFKHLSEACKETRFNQIHATDNKYNNKLGDFLGSHGFSVSMFRDSHEGELKNKPDCTGTPIYKKINDKDLSIFQMPLLQKWLADKNRENKIAAIHESKMSLLDILQFLYECLEDYCSVSHLRHIERPKSPSSVYQMLCWLTGLPHNRVFEKVSVGDIGDLFEKRDEDSGDGNHENPPILDNDPDTVEAYPQAITASSLTSTIQNVCVDAEDVLIGILGHGHADGIYAVDFNTNPDGFSYPTAPGACFDMLADILCRLYQQLYFLYSQCSNDESCAGWRNCSYGRYVGGSNWKCNDFQCDNQPCNQMCKQTCNQIHEQTGGQHPKCGVKSPLQSYLEDGLPGFLPHSFTKPGCKLECTYSNHRGIPCRTPMGFGDISVMASHTQTGTHLTKILRRFCGQRSSLRSLCSNLVCLLQKPPQTLGDMFSFYYNYIYGWNLGGIRHKETAFKAAVKDANFGVADDEFNIHSLFSGSHSSVSIAHSNGSLGGLVCTSSGYAVCGSYLHPITNNIGGVFSDAYAEKYLSWIVYLTETFYDLLHKLYDDCNSKCGSKGSNCHGKACIKDCSTKSSKHLSPTHDAKCKSIIQCTQALPTLYKYGFVFMFQTTLNGNPKISTKRTCSDLCKTLETVLSDKKSEEPILTKLIYVTIPNFLWKIRSKFFWMTVALWSLSLLYLICVMVGRLDVLHIRSHLRIPSSHKITAQSLLAATQVGRLAKISYLQP